MTTALAKTQNTKAPKAKPRARTETQTIHVDAEEDQKYWSWLWLLLTAGVAGGIVGGVAWVRARNKPGEKTTEPSAVPVQGPKSLADLAASLRSEYLKIDGCTVGWKLGDASRTGLVSHYVDFLAPAISDAQVKGAASIDEITTHVASILVPGCPWPPPSLQLIDLDAALAGNLGFVDRQKWAMILAVGGVQVYLALRQVVSTVIAQGRRG